MNYKDYHIIIQCLLDDAKNQLKNTFEDETEDYIKAFSEAYPDTTP